MKLKDITLETVEKKYKPKKTQSVERVLNRSFTQVLFQGRNSIEITDVFISILHEKKSYAFYISQKIDFKSYYMFFIKFSTAINPCL